MAQQAGINSTDQMDIHWIALSNLWTIGARPIVHITVLFSNKIYSIKISLSNINRPFLEIRKEIAKSLKLIKSNMLKKYLTPGILTVTLSRILNHFMTDNSTRGIAGFFFTESSAITNSSRRLRFAGQHSLLKSTSQFSFRGDLQSPLPPEAALSTRLSITFASTAYFHFLFSLFFLIVSHP